MYRQHLERHLALPIELALSSRQSEHLSYNAQSWMSTLSLINVCNREAAFIRGPWLFQVVVVIAVTIARVYTHQELVGVGDAVPVVLGGMTSILLAFRVSASYSRWWEARNLWGNLVNGTRSIVSHALATTAARRGASLDGVASPSDSLSDAEARAEIRQLAGCCIALSISLKYHLRRKDHPWRHLSSRDEAVAPSRSPPMRYSNVGEPTCVVPPAAPRAGDARGAGAAPHLEMISEAQGSPAETRHAEIMGEINSELRDTERAGECKRAVTRGHSFDLPPELEAEINARALLAPKSVASLAASSHPPLHAFALLRASLERLHAGYPTAQLCAFQTTEPMLSGITGSERILRTPCPAGYVGVLRLVIMVWLCMIAFTPTAADLQLKAVPVLAITSWLVLAVEQLAVEIENPFGSDANDLPLDQYVRAVADDTWRLMHE